MKQIGGFSTAMLDYLGVASFLTGWPPKIERQQRQGFDEIQIFGVLCAPSIHENQILRSARGSENPRDEMGWDGVHIGWKQVQLECESTRKSTLIDFRKNVNGVSEQSISGLMT